MSKLLNFALPNFPGTMQSRYSFISRDNEESPVWSKFSLEWRDSSTLVWPSLLQLWWTKLDCGRMVSDWFSLSSSLCFLSLSPHPLSLTHSLCFCVFVWPPVVGFAFSPPLWLLLKQHGANRCDHLLAFPSYQSRCLWVPLAKVLQT